MWQPFGFGKLYRTAGTRASVMEAYMSSFFMEDNIFNRILTKIFDICFLNLLTFALCIPIVTAGASLTAMYAVLLKMAKNEEGPIAKSFWKEFKGNLKGSYIAWIFILAVFILLIFDLMMWTNANTDNRSLFWGITLVIAMLFSAITDWYLAIRAKFVETAGMAFKNAAKFTVIYLPASIIMGAYSAGIVYLITRFPYFIALIPIAGLGILMWPKSLYIRKKFDDFIEDKGLLPEKEDGGEGESADEGKAEGMEKV